MSWFDDHGIILPIYHDPATLAAPPVPRSTMPVGTPQQLPTTGAGGYQPSSGPAINGGNAQDPKQAIQAILAKYPPGSAGLQQAMPEIQKLFPGTRFDTSGGPVDEIVIPGYGIVDLISNAETGGNQAWTWQTSGGQPGGAPMGSLGGGQPGGGVDYTKRMGALEDTPGFKFRFEQGMKAIQDSAAAKGTLLTGGAMKDLATFGQGLASTEYQNEWDRTKGLAEMGFNAATNQGAYGTAYGASLTDLTTGAGNAQAAGTIGSGNAWNGALGNVGQNLFDVGLYKYDQRQRQPQQQAPVQYGWDGLPVRTNGY